MGRGVGPQVRPRRGPPQPSHPFFLAWTLLGRGEQRPFSSGRACPWREGGVRLGQRRHHVEGAEASAIGVGPAEEDDPVSLEGHGAVAVPHAEVPVVLAPLRPWNVVDGRPQRHPRARPLLPPPRRRRRVHREVVRFAFGPPVGRHEGLLALRGRGGVHGSKVPRFRPPRQRGRVRHLFGLKGRGIGEGHVRRQARRPPLPQRRRPCASLRCRRGGTARVPGGGQVLVGGTAGGPVATLVPNCAIELVEGPAARVAKPAVVSHIVHQCIVGVGKTRRIHASKDVDEAADGAGRPAVPRLGHGLRAQPPASLRGAKNLEGPFELPVRAHPAAHYQNALVHEVADPPRLVLFVAPVEGNGGEGAVPRPVHGRQGAPGTTRRVSSLQRLHRSKRALFLLAAPPRHHNQRPGCWIDQVRLA
mmetsp:Transcript_10680/g.24940  ORF Transcript_10680/g.24940 Transcript_10680/m.24940 type:complete len:417 (-) Transcript_10680:1126-2376(-)